MTQRPPIARVTGLVAALLCVILAVANLASGSPFGALIFATGSVVLLVWALWVAD